MSKTATKEERAHFDELAQEEARYELWLMGDGPDKATKANKDLAYAYLAKHMNGWRTLSHDMVRDGDIHVLEAVVRLGDQVRLIRWTHFNKGFMTNHNSLGWVIFDPTKLERI